MERKPGLDKETLAKILSEFKDEVEEPSAAAQSPGKDAPPPEGRVVGEEEQPAKSLPVSPLTQDLEALLASHGLSMPKGPEARGATEASAPVTRPSQNPPQATAPGLSASPTMATPMHPPVIEQQGDGQKLTNQEVVLAPTASVPSPPAAPPAVRRDEVRHAATSPLPAAPAVGTAPPAKQSGAGVLSRFGRRKTGDEPVPRGAEPAAYSGPLEIEVGGSPAPALLDRFQAELGQVPGLEYRGTWGSSQGHVALHLEAKRSLSVLQTLRRMSMVADARVAATTPHLKVKAVLEDRGGAQLPSPQAPAAASVVAPGEVTLTVSPMTGIAELLRFQGVVRGWPGVDGILKTVTVDGGRAVRLTLSLGKQALLEDWERDLPGAILELQGIHEVRVTLPSSW